MNLKTGAVIASAVAALLAAGCGPGQDNAQSQQVKCQGINECKGTSECASASGNACQGLNECAGQGWVTAESAEACTSQGGTVITG